MSRVGKKSGPADQQSSGRAQQRKGSGYSISVTEPEMEPDEDYKDAKLSNAAVSSSAPRPPTVPIDPKKDRNGKAYDYNDLEEEHLEGATNGFHSFETIVMTKPMIEAVSHTWQLYQKRMGSLQKVGDAMHKAFLDMVPTAKQLFVSPSVILAGKLADAVDAIVRDLSNPASVRQRTETIGFLHANYAAMDKEHIHAFTGVIMEQLEMEMADEMSTIAKEGWSALLSYLGKGVLACKANFDQHATLIKDSWENLKTAKLDASHGSDDSSESDRDSDMRVQNTYVPTTYPEMFQLNCQVMGFETTQWLTEIVNCFDDIVVNVSETHRVQEECEMLALRISLCTTGPVKFDEHKACMLASLRSLLPKDWSSQHEVSWTWLWENIQRLLLSVLGKPPMFIKALDSFRDSMDEGHKYEMRKAIYDRFFELEQAGEDFFKQSNTRLHYIVSRIMEMTSEILRQPTEVAEQISALGLRHVGYGVYPALLAPYVSASIEVVSVHGKDANLLVAYSWSMNMIAKILARVIKEGSTIVMKAIEANSEKSLRKAISSAPRGKRAMCLLRVQVGTQRISPLLWALECGRLEAASAIIKDLLTIRADRERYYYGADALFDEHPDIVQRLGEDAPTLLPTLFEGLVWRARHTKNGERRVNYYVKHLIVGPKGLVSDTLHWLHDLQDPKIISHPVVSLVSDQLWMGIVKRQFILSKVWFIFSLLVFMLSQCILPNLDHAGYIELPVRIAIAVGRSVNYVLSMGGLSVLHIKRCARGYLQRDTIRVLRIPVPKYLTDTYDLGSFLLMLFLWTMFSHEPLVRCWGEGRDDDILLTTCERVDEIEFRYAIFAMCAMFIHWLLLIDLAVFSTSLSAFVLVCGHVLSEIGRFLIALAFLLLTFGSAISVLPTEKEWLQDLVSASTALFAIIVRLYDDDYRSVEDEPALLMAIFAFVTASTVMLLNLLIAQLNCSYEFVYQDMVGFARLNRASIIVEVLGKCKQAVWESFVSSLKLDQALEFNEGDVGIPGGLQVMEPANLNPTMVDAIHRFGGSSSPDMRWPEEHAGQEQEEDKLKHIERYLNMVIKRAQKMDGQSSGSGGGDRSAGSGRKRGGAESGINMSFGSFLGGEDDKVNRSSGSSVASFTDF